MPNNPRSILVSRRAAEMIKSEEMSAALSSGGKRRRVTLFSPVLLLLLLQICVRPTLQVGSRESRRIDRFCDYSCVYCVNSLLCRENAINGKHKIHQTCQSDAV